MDRLLKKIKTGSNNSIQESNECQFCHGTGMEFYIENGIEYARECRCGIRQKRIMDSRKEFADIPETFRDIRIDCFDTGIYELPESRKIAEIALKAVKYWLNHFDSMYERGIGLYMHSHTKGSGKTMMAVSVANELLHSKQLRVKFSTSLQILSEIKASWNDDKSSQSESNLLGMLCTADVLVIDDFGMENAEKAWVNERFYQIINTRYVQKKITIYTSNEKLDELKFDDRIVNRIKERTYSFPFPEESIRDIIAKNNMKELINGIRGE